jgi:hypothetical protein
MSRINSEGAVCSPAYVLRNRWANLIARGAGIVFVLSMTLIPVLERLFLRDLIRRGEREGKKIEAVREKVQFKAAKNNHAR